MDNKFLNRVTELIRDKGVGKLISAELESHLLDKIDYYTEIGYSREEAVKKATEEMGDPDDTAVPLNSLHKRGIGKNIRSIITAVFAVLIALLSFNIIPIEHLFRYGDESYSIVHSVSVDFLSLFICAAYLLLLYKAYKHKNIVSAAFILMSLLVIAFAYFPNMNYPAFQFSLFQPLFYPAAMISMHGLSAFYNSIFGYGYIPDSDRLFYNCGAVVMYLILLTASVTLFIAILRQSKMKKVCRLWLPIKIAKPVLSLFILIDLLVLSLATVPALTSLDEKRDEMQTAKERAIQYVINADLSNGTEDFNNELLKDGYEYYFNEDNIWQSGQKTLHSGFNDSLIITAPFDEGKFAVCCLTDLDKNYVLTRGDYCLTEEERELVKTNMTLDEFMSLGLHKKAAMVEKSVYPDAYPGEKGQITIEFSFDLSGEGFNGYTYNFDYNSKDQKYYMTGSEKMLSDEEIQALYDEMMNQEINDEMLTDYN